jgi:hypothetical protein
MAGCIGVKPTGELCKGVARRGSDWCPAHDPAREEARRRNASKAARSKPGREIKDLKGQLADLAAAVLDGTTEPKIGAVVTQIVNARTRLLETERRIRETEVLERRLEELEALLEPQNEGGGGRRWGA